MSGLCGGSRAPVCICGVKLLFDQNLSPRLVASVSDRFPGSAHVRTLGLASSDDAEVWRAAAAGGYTIATKDADFHQMSFLYGHPPKVVWLRLGNCTTQQIEAVLRARVDVLREFENDAEASFLALS